jgi:hypothetical protein
MTLSFFFKPARRKGLIFQISAGVLLAVLDGAAFWVAAQQAEGAYFVLLLLLCLGLLAPLLLVVYRIYSLVQARYMLERDGLRLRWGLRAEDIPLPDVEWVRPASELAYPLKLPLLNAPGAILGTLTVPDLGPVEFMASDISRMLLVATPTKVYAISPSDPLDFLSTFQRVIELGSLAPIRPTTTLPAAYLQSVWDDRAARILGLTSFLLTVALFVVVSLAIPNHAPISLGWQPNGLPLKAGPSERLLLLPVLAGFSFILDLILGLFFYRHPTQRPAAFLLWAGGVITPILFLVAVALLV